MDNPCDCCEHYKECYEISDTRFPCAEFKNWMKLLRVALEYEYSDQEATA